LFEGGRAFVILKTEVFQSKFSRQKMSCPFSMLYGGRSGKMHSKGLVKKNQSELKILSKLLVIIGALNWGFVGILNFDPVAALFGKKSILSRMVYTLVGLSGVYLIMVYKDKYEELKKRWHLKGEKKYSGKQYSWSGIQ
jgi:uncharacterized membrane protein YuzA (DUF378 family)